MRKIVLVLLCFNMIAYGATVDADERSKELNAMLEARVLRCSGTSVTAERIMAGEAKDSGSIKLTEILLDRTGLEHAALTKIFADFLANTAPVIDLSHNNLGDRSIHRIAQILMQESLQRLNLEGNHFSEEVRAYFRLLNETQRAVPIDLKMDTVSLDPVEIESIATKYGEIRSMLEARELSSSRRKPTQLEISMMIIGCRVIAGLSAKKTSEEIESTDLKKVLLDHSGLTHEELSQIFSVLKIRKAPFIDLSYNNLGDRSLKRIEEILSETTLETLNLSGNFFSDGARTCLRLINSKRSTPVALTL